MRRLRAAAASILAFVVCLTRPARVNDAIDARVEREIADGMFLGTVVIAGTPKEHAVAIGGLQLADREGIADRLASWVDIRRIKPTGDT